MMNTQPGFHNKEENLRQKMRCPDHATDRPQVIVNQIHYSFDTEAREKAFVHNQFTTDEERRAYAEYREEWFRRPRDFDAGEAPLAVNCELVSTCDLACPMCYTTTEEFKTAVAGSQRMMPWPIAKAIIDEAAELGVPFLALSWRGESTLYRWHDGKETITFPDVLAYARARGILEIMSLTHGQRIDAAMAEAIVDAAPNWISVSMDGIHENYDKIRSPVKTRDGNKRPFTVVVENIRRLIAIRDAKGRTRPRIRSNTIYPAIAEDTGTYRDFLVDLGIDLITVNELLDLRDGTVADEMIMENWACQYPFQRLSVTASGVIFPCTGAFKEQDAMVLGRYRGSQRKRTRAADGSWIESDVPEMTLHEAWHGDKLERIRELHRTGQRELLHPGCRHCSHGVKKHGADRLHDQWNDDSLSWDGRTRTG